MAVKSWFWAWYFMSNSNKNFSDDHEKVKSGGNAAPSPYDDMFSWCDTFVDITAMFGVFILVILIFLAFSLPPEGKEAEAVKIVSTRGAALFLVALIIAYIADRSLGLR